MKVRKFYSYIDLKFQFGISKTIKNLFDDKTGLRSHFATLKRRDFERTINRTSNRRKNLFYPRL